jgi:hypothetical protein
VRWIELVPGFDGGCIIQHIIPYYTIYTTGR